MAIFHFHESNISRSDGRSAVACAAYRACEKLEDYTYGKVQDYTPKKGLEYKNIYAPEHTNEKLLDRQTLWNTVEIKEFNANGSMKINARLSKEYECALPHELTDQERIKIVDDFCQDFVKKHNVIVDACIHAPHQYNNESNNKNYHVHIMFTTRVVNEKGELGKKQRTFNDNGPEILKDSRATFASVVNTVLENAGLDERIDHRSYKDQSLDFLEATAHEGHEVTALRRQGIDTEISLKNDAIKAKNLAAAQEYQQTIKDLDQEIILPSQLKNQITELESKLQFTTTEENGLLIALENLEQEEQYINKAYEKFIEGQEQYINFYKEFDKITADLNRQLKELGKNFKKSEKWLSKQYGFYESGGVFYDDYHHKQINIDKPPYFLLQKDFYKKEEKIIKQYNQDVIMLSDTFHIESTIINLKSNANILRENEIELPVNKPTLIQRLKCEYVHSFNTLDDFNQDVQPILDEHQADLRRYEQERLQGEVFAQKYRERERQLDEERRQWQAKVKLEAEKNLKYEKMMQQARSVNNEFKPKKKDNDNDYTP